MSVEIWAQLLAGIFGAMVGGAGLVGLLARRWEQQLEARLASDRALTDRRLERYQSLWKLFKPLALTGSRARVAPTYATLDELCREMVDWYYDEGGMLMSKRTQQVFLFLKDELGSLREPLDQPLSEAAANRYFDLGSVLRSAMCADLASRREVPNDLVADKQWIEERLAELQRERELKAREARQRAG